MGNFVGKAMEESMQRNQQFMTEINRTTLERQIQMQNQMRERAAAMQVAKARDLFYWLGSFYVLAGLGMVAGFSRTRKPAAIAPLLPLTFIVAYHADLAYGTKLNRIKAESENILMYERDLIDMPAGLPSLASIDAGRLKAAEESKYHAKTHH